MLDVKVLKLPDQEYAKDWRGILYSLFIKDLFYNARSDIHRFDNGLAPNRV